jgi:hypothetical protein
MVRAASTQITRSRRGAADPTEGNAFPDRPIAGTPKDMT